jgi:hypothetical protein
MRYILSASAIALALTAVATPLQTTLEAQQAASSAAVPAGEVALGTVTIGRNVLADGKPLRAGTYRLRLTGNQAQPVPPGQTAEYERWVEFLRGNQVVGREVVSIVPQSEIKDVAQDAPPRAGAAKVQLLKGNDYLRIWVNRGGTHYLVHLPTEGAAS